MKSENKKLIIWIFVVAVIFVVILCLLIPYIKESKLDAKMSSEIQALRETPAAEYCENNWWILDIKVDELDDVYWEYKIYWVCNFDDWSACEVVEYFRWECLSASEQSEKETLYCSDWSVCDDNSESLNNWIEDINDMEIEDDSFIETMDSGEFDVLDEFEDIDDADIDALYDYYESEFTNTGNEEWIESL